MSQKKRIRVLIAEEGVKTYSGHWTPYSASIAEGLEALGCEVIVAGNKAADQKVIESLPFKPVFRYSRWDGTYEHRPWLERKALVLLHNWRVYHDMSAFLKRSEPFDIVFCGNIIVYHSFAWIMLTKKFLGKKFHHLTLMMVQPAGMYDSESKTYRFPSRAKALAWSLSKTFRRGKGRVSFAVETPAAQAEFSQLTGHPVNLLHHPVEAPKSTLSPEKDSPRLSLVCPGFARHEKGTDILLKAIRILSNDSKATEKEFILQWKKGESFKDASGETIHPDYELEKNGIVKYLGNELRGEDYWQFLANADIIVLPYRCYPYTTRLSRVTIEALMMGKPVIYPKDSWLDYAVNRSGTGVAFEDGSAKALASAISEAIAKIEALSRPAQDQASAAAVDYSPKRFAELLLELSQSE